MRGNNLIRCVTRLYAFCAVGMYTHTHSQTQSELALLSCLLGYDCPYFSHFLPFAWKTHVVLCMKL